jgi:TatD DNase family protein
MILTDSHCHIDVTEFDADRDAVIARARAVGVTRQIVPAVAFASWPHLRAVCTQYPGLSPAYGLHPMYLPQHRPEHVDALRDWIVRERPVAVGECGLDFFVQGLDADAQRSYFDAQLRIAREFDLPLIVHARRAVEEVIASIRRVGQLRGVVHSFSGSEEQARQLWQLGFCLGLGGPLTYPGAHRLRRLAAAMPLQQLLLETDSPDQPHCGHQGQRNEPARLIDVVQTVAQLRGESHERIAEATTHNAERLFGRAHATTA